MGFFLVFSKSNLKKLCVCVSLSQKAWCVWAIRMLQMRATLTKDEWIPRKVKRVRQWRKTKPHRKMNTKNKKGFNNNNNYYKKKERKIRLVGGGSRKAFSQWRTYFTQNTIIAGFDVSLYTPSNPLQNPHATSFDLSYNSKSNPPTTTTI